MDKIILIFYICVKDMQSYEQRNVFENIKRAFDTPKDNILHYFVAVQTDTRVECVNPKVVSKEDYANALEVIDRYKTTINEIIANRVGEIVENFPRIQNIPKRKNLIERFLDLFGF